MAGRKRVWPVQALLFLVLARLLFHAFFVPVFEGPDEPFHLGRIAAWADLPWTRAFIGGPVPQEIVASIRAHPCGPDLRRAFDCPPFSGRGAAFNILQSTAGNGIGQVWENSENNQPPLHYFVAGLPIRSAESLRGTSWPAETRLLLSRLFSFFLVGLALLWPLRLVAASRSSAWKIAGLVLLLLPGASEALVRCSNDASVFLWCSLSMLALERRPSTWTLAALLVVGPLIKLTAFPIVAVLLVVLWQRGRVRNTLLGVACALLVFPIQLARGWLWGGTYELNRRVLPFDEPTLSVAKGIARSIYVFVKTVFWLGEWSFFRAPILFIVAYFTLIFLWLMHCRVRSNAARAGAHAAGGAVALAGFFLFVFANRRLYGVWGGVGGWYFWTWFPWLSVAATDLLRLRPTGSHLLVATSVAFVVFSNAAFLWIAFQIYG